MRHFLGPGDVFSQLRFECIFRYTRRQWRRVLGGRRGKATELVHPNQQFSELYSPGSSGVIVRRRNLSKQSGLAGRSLYDSNRSACHWYVNCVRSRWARSPYWEPRLLLACGSDRLPLSRKEEITSLEGRECRRNANVTAT